MKHWQLWGAALTALALIAALAGCGGGSSGTSTALGMISGTVSADGAQLFTADSRATDTATIAVDGTDIATEALPGERFTLRNVPPGLHTLVVRTGRRATAVVVAVKRGAATEVGDMVLREAGSIAGTVTAKDTGSLLAGAKVVVTETVLTTDAAEMPHPVRVTRTNADGFYSLSGVPVGAYLVSIAKPGYAAVTLTLTVAVGATVIGDTALPALPPAETGAMKGLVSLKLDDGTTKPLGGVLVRLARVGDLQPERPAPSEAQDAGGAMVPLYDKSRVEADPALRERYTYTAEDGSYLLDGVPAGNYVAVAVRPGLEPQKQPVTILANSTLEVNFTLTVRVLPVATITGTVTNAAAASALPKPVAGAWVRAIVGPEPMPAGRLEQNGAAWGSAGVMIAPETYVLSAQTDANGTYTLLVPPVVAAIAVYAEGFAPQRVAVTVTPGAVTTADVALQPQSTGNVTLSGTVFQPTNAAKATVAGAKVYAQPMALDDGVVTMNRPITAVIYTADTDVAGVYTMPLRPGVYLLYAEKDEFRSERILRKVYEDGTQDFLVLPPRPLAGP